LFAVTAATMSLLIFISIQNTHNTGDPKG
jgi:hypothetical protein